MCILYFIELVNLQGLYHSWYGLSVCTCAHYNIFFYDICQTNYATCRDLLTWRSICRKIRPNFTLACIHWHELWYLFQTLQGRISFYELMNYYSWDICLVLLLQEPERAPRNPSIRLVRTKITTKLKISLTITFSFFLFSDYIN